MSEIITIARIRNDFQDKFGIPRQSGIVNSVRAAIVFEPDYRNPDALRGLDKFTHIWLVWGFSEAKREVWSPTVRPPRLGGNDRVGVFATRSPYRPNGIGLSSVRLDGIELHTAQGPVIYVLGADLLDGSPIYDIKPYIPYTDCHPDALGGFADNPPERKLKVEIGDRWQSVLPDEVRTPLMEILAYDPRPSYHDDPERVYGMDYAGVNIQFVVKGDRLIICGARENP